LKLAVLILLYFWWKMLRRISDKVLEQGTFVNGSLILRCVLNFEIVVLYMPLAMMYDLIESRISLLFRISILLFNLVEVPI
jgi:hypothetical protein